MSELTDRRVQQRRRNAKRKKAMKRKLRALVILMSVLFFIFVGLFMYFVLWNPVKEEVTIEAGDGITLDMFIEDERASFVTDVKSIDTKKEGTHSIVVSIGNREFESLLTIKDTIAPTGEPVEVTTKAGALPFAEEFVKNVKDCSDVKISYKTVPDVTIGGDAEVVIVLTDASGNNTEIKSVVHVITDSEPPVITGAQDISIFLGGTVSYRAGITVTDNEDENPSLSIDNSKVNLDEVGEYEVTYTATDAAGNSSSVTITLTVKKKPANYVDEERVMELANEVLASITNDSMTDREVAFAIYRWTYSKIAYVNDSDKSSWVKGAYQAFTQKSGDCFNYFAAAKALFQAAGIENIDVIKSDTSHSQHFWSLINLGDGWYHVDCTRRSGTGDLFFMVTDAELEAYSVKHKNSHIFDKNAYPERATESIQDEIDYSWRSDA